MKKCTTFLICFLLLAGIAAAQPSDAYIQNIMTRGHMPGMNTAIVKDGHWMYQRNWGKADIANNVDVSRRTVFMMASVSKTIAATALMQLWEKGAFRMDDNVNGYLPFPVQNPAYPSDSVTFRMLVTHTSSIKDNGPVMGSLYVYGDSPISLDTFLRNYFVPGGTYYNATANFYNYHTGSTYNYSNIGATLAAYLVQRITGDDFGHYCDTAIFQKICMDNTSFHLAGFPDTSIIARPYMWYNGALEDAGLYGYPDYPDGQLRTNITALARFMTMYMQYGTYEGTRILDSATVAYMMQPQTAANSTQGIMFGQYKVGNDTLWGHTGGDAGVSTAMFFNYRSKTGVIVLTNGDGAVTYNMLRVMDTMYRYGVTLTPSATNIFPLCGVTTAVPNVAGNAANARLFPNPATQTAWLLLEPAGNEVPIISMTDLLGRPVKKILCGAGVQKVPIDLTGVSDGLYLVQIIYKTSRQTLKLVVGQ